MPNETDGFLRPKVVSGKRSQGCCYSKATWNCCIATGVFGGIFVLLGIIVIIAGEGYLEKKIISSMALTEGSSRTESWCRPPVMPHLEGYAFHVTNPEAVLAGKKPMLEEKGPYVYDSVTVKDSDDNMIWHEDGTLEYRPRKIYHYNAELSCKGCDPHNDWLVIPNIPLWTGLHGAGTPTAKGIARDIVTNNGRGTPFVNVTFHGLLWGYDDELPCLKMDQPAGCASEDDPFGGDSDDDADFGDDDFGWRKKRSVDEEELTPFEQEWGVPQPKAEFVDCKCQWGLFRDRNLTMRESVRFMTGINDLSKKGIVTEYRNKKTLDWWKEGSHCDVVGGQDSSTLPPQLTEDTELNVFIALMCRLLPMEFEKVRAHFDGPKVPEFGAEKMYCHIFVRIFFGNRSSLKILFFRLS